MPSNFCASDVSRPRVALGVDLSEPLPVDVGIDLGYRDVCMTELTADRIQNIIQKTHGSVTLSHLESVPDASFNRIFLAIDRLAAEEKKQFKHLSWLLLRWYRGKDNL